MLQSGSEIEFILDDSLAEVAPNLEIREDTVSYAQNSSWVWGHTYTSNPGAPAGPTSSGTPMFQINSDPWLPYTGPVSVSMNSNIRVQFLTVDPSRYQDSNVNHAYFHPVPSSLSGTAIDDLYSAPGGANLQYSVTNGNDYFEHGAPECILDGEPVGSGAPNSLEFVATDSFGGSSTSRFHVYESATGTGEIPGTLLPN